MTEPGAQDRPFRVDEATIEELHAAIKAGRTTCVAVVQHYIDRVRAYNGVASLLVTEDGAPVPEARGTVRAMAALRFPTETVKASTILPDLHKYQGPALEYGRMEATASDPGVHAAVRDDRRQAGCRAAECARDPQHSRRAIGDLPGRLRSPPVGGAAPAGRAARVRDVPPAPRRPRARGRARRDVRTQSRSREDADVRRRVLVQGSVRHEGHANDRRRRRPLRHRLPGARSRAGRAAPQQGRDHLRQGGQHRIQRASGEPRRPPRARQGAAVDPGLPAQHLGRQPGESLRHDALGLARLELRLGRVGQRQSRHGEPRRGDARVLPRPGQPQRGGAHPSAQVDARVQRRRHRRRHLLRPQRHPVPHDRRLRQGPRRAEGSESRAITTRATSTRPCRARRC